jgi:Concanavalin A-like lectin/glucanases superfamily
MAVDDSYSKSLLHFNGADASTTFTDESGKSWTAIGDAKLSTTTPKFGSACLVLDGSDAIDTPDSADFDVGSGDFTVDGWFKKAADNTAMYFYAQYGALSTSSAMYIEAADYTGANHVSATILYDGGATATTITQAGTVTGTDWHHIALVRNGNTLTLYLDGTSVASASVTGITVRNSAYKPTIGRQGENNARYFNGRIDEFRFSKGIARWTSNFTPPTAEYGAVAFRQSRALLGVGW